MSLRRRIAAAASLAVAAVAVVTGVFAYLSTRSHLLGETRGQLQTLARPYLQPHDHGGPLGGDGAGAAGGNAFGPPSAGRPDLAGHGPFQGHPGPAALGGAPGYFQTVRPSGQVRARNGGTPELPVDARVLTVARGRRHSFYWSTKVAGIHVEILTIHDRYDHDAVEVALPLTSADSVLHGLLITYAVMLGAGILAAALIGLVVARAALSPIERFTRRTEQVSGTLEAPQRRDEAPRRLEESGASELRRLAASFNGTLEALERSVQAQRHLIADASHELRTPLAALRSNIQIFLEAERLPQEERAELQSSIVAELDELTQLVSDVLDLARGAGPSDHVEPVELDLVVREAVARAQRRAPTLEFTTDLEPTLVVNAPERINRALTNIIDNARKWSPPDGLIEVTLRDGSLTVRDHGPGFREADLAHVFDRFYRSQQARRMPGSGLGLAIVRQAAEAFGGSAEAANAPDGGAILRVRFGSAGPVPTRADEKLSV